jgi:hypothetical protein
MCESQVLETRDHPTLESEVQEDEGLWSGLVSMSLAMTSESFDGYCM